MILSLSPEQYWAYTVSLSLKIRSTSGVAFQDFFSTVMEKVHGSNFIRVRPFGSLGDKGCDGYLQSTGATYQSYGKLSDAAVNVVTLVQKAGDDYSLASSNLSTIMKEWHFAHNLVDGVPVELVQKIEALRTANTQHKIGLFGPAALEAEVFKLSPLDLGILLGPAATAADSMNLKMDEVRDLIQSLMSQIADHPGGSGSIVPVPFEKLEFNKLPGHWLGLLKLGMQNAGYVREYCNRHSDPEIGEKLANVFNAHYRALKLEGLDPGSIMDKLYQQITGVGIVTTQRQVAAQAVLAHLFESCDIFEARHAMILPSKHLSANRALINVGGEILAQLDQPATVSELWDKVRITGKTGANAVPLTFDWFVMALSFLHSIAAIDYSEALIVARQQQ